MKSLDLFLATMSALIVIATMPANAAAIVRTDSTAERRLDHCSWDRPGVDPFMGDVVAAVDHYRDMAPATRQKLKDRMVKREYDEIVSIDRDGIRGKSTYGSTIRDMHFGTNQVCGSVTRASWRPDMKERGLVYCEGRECILVPTVCRNVSRVSRAEVMGGAAASQEGAPDTAVAAAPAEAAAPEGGSATGDGPGAGDSGAGGGVPASSDPSSFAVLSGPGAGGGLGGIAGGGDGGNLGRPFGGDRSDGPDLFPRKYAIAPSTHAPRPIDHIDAGPSFTPFTPRVPTMSPSIGPVTSVPEPQSLLLMAAGLAALGLRAQRRRATRSA